MTNFLPRHGEEKRFRSKPPNAVAFLFSRQRHLQGHAERLLRAACAVRSREESAQRLISASRIFAIYPSHEYLQKQSLAC